MNRRIVKFILILMVMGATLLTAVVLPLLGQDRVIFQQSGRGLHYLGWQVDLVAGQRLQINASCVDATGTGIGPIHEFHINLPWRSDNYFPCFDVNRIFVVPHTGTYNVIFHVHTNTFGPDGGEDYGRFWFDYNATFTLLEDAPANPPASPTDEPTEPPASPTDEPEVTTEPTDPPASPTDEPETTVEPTDPPASPTDEPESTVEPTDPPASPTDEPESTVEPTDPPPGRGRSRAATPEPSQPVPPPDDRLNWMYGDLTAVIYRGRDDQGFPSLVIYGVNEVGRGYFLCTVQKADLGDYAETAPPTNQFIKLCGTSVNVFVLNTGEIQVNIREANKEFITITDTLAARAVQHYMFEG